MELFLKDRGVSFQVSSHSPDGLDAIEIKPGETARIFNMRGPAIIQNMWMTFASVDKLHLRYSVLRMYWDDEVSPSVECPAGDFFGVGFGERTQYLSQTIGCSSGGYYSYFPMPFRVSGVIEVTNESEAPLILFYHFLGVRDLPLPDGALYFHSCWRRENPVTRGVPYRVLKAEGDGYFAGMALMMQAYHKNDRLNFLEGDEFIYIDGEETPSIRGTGTEDYFQGGWYFADGVFSAPYHGLTVKDRENSRIACYRHHIQDRINFTRSIMVELEHGQRPENEAKADYQSTAYWYQSEPHLSFEPLCADREPIITKPAIITPHAVEFHEHPSLKIITNPMYIMSTYNEIPWSRQAAGHFDMDRFPDGVSMDFEIARSGEYRVRANYIANDHNCMLLCLVDGTPVGDPVDTYSDDPKDAHLLCTNRAMGLKTLGTLELKRGRHLVTIQMVGRNEKAKGDECIIDCVTFEPIGE